MSEDEVEIVLKTSGKAMSLDAPMSDSEDSNSLLSALGQNEEPDPDKRLIDESLKRQITISLSSLSDKEKDILKYYYGLDGNAPHSLEDISEKVGLTRERVRQIKENSLKRLRKGSNSKVLKTYL
jgi:RNA polymerase primary sigma factor